MMLSQTELALDMREGLGAAALDFHATYLRGNFFGADDDFEFRKKIIVDLFSTATSFFS
jgi:hypothetical protein